MPTIRINLPVIYPALVSSGVQVTALKDPVGGRPLSPVGAVGEEAVDPSVAHVVLEDDQDPAHAQNAPAFS